MNLTRRAFVLGASALAVQAVRPALAVGLDDLPMSDPMPTSGRARMVRQWIEFGSLHPEMVPLAPDEIRLTAETWALLRELAQSPRVTVYERGDLSHWRITDGRVGNCATATLTWWRDAVRAGLPLGAISPAICRVPYAADPHLLPIVLTDRGAFAVEPFFRSIQPWRRLPYQWDRRLIALNEWGAIRA